MLWVAVSTESVIKAAAAPSPKGSGPPMNPCVSSSKNGPSESVVGFEALELI